MSAFFAQRSPHFTLQQIWSSLPQILIRRAIYLMAVFALHWFMLPEPALAAQPSDVVICPKWNTGLIICAQRLPNDLTPNNQVFWHPQGVDIGPPVPPPPRSMQLTAGIIRLTLAGNLPLVGSGNGSTSIMVGNRGSNSFSNGGSSTFVLGNSGDPKITRLPSCTVTSTDDCLVVKVTGNPIEKDEVIFTSGTNNAVYINQAMETDSCLNGLYYWKQDYTQRNPPDLGKFVMGATTYGGGKLNSTGGWIDGGCSITPVP